MCLVLAVALKRRLRVFARGLLAEYSCDQPDGDERDGDHEAGWR